jgi:hypothetical protein
VRRRTPAARTAAGTTDDLATPKWKQRGSAAPNARGPHRREGATYDSTTIGGGLGAPPLTAHTVSCGVGLRDRTRPGMRASDAHSAFRERCKHYSS